METIWMKNLTIRVVASCSLLVWISVYCSSLVRDSTDSRFSGLSQVSPSRTPTSSVITLMAKLTL